MTFHPFDCVKKMTKVYENPFEILGKMTEETLQKLDDSAKIKLSSVILLT